MQCAKGQPLPENARLRLSERLKAESVASVAKSLGLHPRTVQHAARGGRLYRATRCYLVPLLERGNE